MSYTKCVYHECDNTSHQISMFRFPVNDKGRLLLWIRNSGNNYLDSLTNNELSRRYICAAHFPPSSIHHGSSRKRLIGPAIPIHFATEHDIEEGTLSSAMTEDNMETDIPSPPVLKVKTPTKFYLKRRRSVSEERSKTLSSTISIHELYDPASPRLSRKCMFEGPKRRLSRKCLFQQNEGDTPRRKRLKDMASQLLKKNQALQAKLRRREKSIKKPSEPEKYRSEVSKTLAMMQLRNANDKKKWSTEEKKFCLSLYYKSPAAYIYLRRQGVVLASPSTIRKWLSKSNCLPGLTPDVFKQIQTRFESESIKTRSCVICFDEMAIMLDLEYSKKYDLVEGFEDLGGNKRTSKLAKYALVFMVRGLYSSWKLPVAYFLSHTNVSAENLKLILRSLIAKLFDHSLLPKAVVCDQASTNQKLYKTLGATKDKPFFYCNDRKLFALFDVPHLIKNIRNNMLTNNYTYKGREISFDDVRKTYELDKQSTKSRSLVKITERHIYPNSFQKMRVSLATQIFSNSVAAAIKTAKETGQLRSQTAEETYKFIKLVNDWFDALNSRKQFDKNPQRHALSKKSMLVRKSIIEGIEVFKDLHKISEKKFKSGKTEKILTRPPCFDGVIQTCKAVMQIFEEESTEASVFFLITTKLNQDVIENLFARFRQKGGSNRNPSARQLRTIFRSNLVNSLIKLPGSKNCADEDDVFIDINHEEELPTSVQEPNSSRFILQREEPAKSLECEGKDKDPLPGPSSANSNVCTPFTSPGRATLEDCSVAYFAGYLAKMCIKKFGCCLCVRYLVKDLDLEDESQLLILNKSYSFNKTIKLKMPSDNLVKFVNTALDCYNMHIQNLIQQVHVKSQLNKTIMDFFRCEAGFLLNISCEEHLTYIVNHMILVKIYFYCKNKKTSTKHDKMHPKLRILKNI